MSWSSWSDLFGCFAIMASFFCSFVAVDVSLSRVTMALEYCPLNTLSAAALWIEAGVF